MASAGRSELRQKRTFYIYCHLKQSIDVINSIIAYTVWSGQNCLKIYIFCQQLPPETEALKPPPSCLPSSQIESEVDNARSFHFLASLLMFVGLLFRVLTGNALQTIWICDYMTAED